MTNENMYSQRGSEINFDEEHMKSMNIIDSPKMMGEKGSSVEA